MKDFFHINPSAHNDKPLVGMAVGAKEEDLDRVRTGLDLGVGVIVVDSSHGNCAPILEQCKRITEINDGRAAIIAGNVADIDGYVRLAEIGVDAVKCGIGSGSICTTSSVTGVGVPMFTLLRELSFARAQLQKEGRHAPEIIADGGINTTGHVVIALAAGAHACMSGKMFAGATESYSCVTRGVTNGMVYYRGMASDAAIDARSAGSRYGEAKNAPEGVTGYVPYLGPLRSWIGKTVELIRGGFGHVGAHTIDELHTYSNDPMAFVRFTGAGQQQNATRVDLSQ